MKRLVLVFLATLLSGVAHAADLTIGLIPEQNIFKQKERYAPLGEYLTKKTGVRLKFTVLPRYGNLIQRFSSEKLDGAFFGSFTAALAIEKLGVEPIARPVNLDGTSTYRGYIFVRKDSGIRDVAHMKGKTVAFVEKATTAGYVFPVAYFRERGVPDVALYFKELYFAGSHDAAINAVLNRKADVGCAKHSMYDRVSRKDPRVQRELLVLAQSPDVPSNGLAVAKDVDPSVQRQLKAALLGMDRDPEGVKVLKQFEALRFIPLLKADYAPVFTLASKAGIDIKTYEYMNE